MACIGRIDDDRVDPADRKALAGELGPGGAQIGRLPEAAGVRPDVDRVRLRLGGSDPGDRRVLVRVERTEIVLLRRYRPGQCIPGRADLREGRAPVGRAIEDVPPEVDDRRVARIENERGVRGDPRRVPRPEVECLRDPAGVDVPPARADLEALVVDVVVRRVDQHPVTVAAAERVPQGEVGRLRGRGPGADAPVVLEARCQPRGVVLCDREMVRLVPRLVSGVYPRPVRAVRVRAINAAVVAEVHPVGNVGVPRHCVLVGVDAARVRPGLPGIERLAEADVAAEEVVLVRGVDPDAAEPPLVAARSARATAGDERVATVVRDVEALVRAVRAAEDDVDAVGIGRRNRDADPAEAGVTFQAGAGHVVAVHGPDHVLEPRPGVASVVRAVETGADPAVHAGAVVALVVPEGRENPVVVRRVDRQVDSAGGRVRRRQDELPVLAPVRDAVDAALTGDAGDRAGRRDEHALRVNRVDDDASDRRALHEPPVLPRLAAVGRLVDAVAKVREPAARRVRLAGSGPERAVGAQGERAHCLGRVVRPGGLEGAARVRRLPDATARHRRVHRVRLIRVDDEIDDAGPDVRGADELPPVLGTLRDRAGLSFRLCDLRGSDVPTGRPFQREVVRRPRRAAGFRFGGRGRGRIAALRRVAPASHDSCRCGESRQKHDNQESFHTSPI